jgi:hypothetical protein
MLQFVGCQEGGNSFVKYGYWIVSIDLEVAKVRFLEPENNKYSGSIRSELTV